MSSIDEKRMYGDSREETVAYVASGQGVATVKVSGDQIGRFGLAHRCEARDLATADGRLYVATPEDVLVGPDEFESLEFGGAVAVAAGEEGDDDILAADEGGTVSRYRDGDWTALGTVDDVRALDGEFVAAADGVYRASGESLTPVGLDDVTDVAADGAPLAATGTGLYRLGNGWLSKAEGEFTVVAAGVGGHAERAHAATDEDLFQYDGSDWTAVDLPVGGSVADVGYGECVYAVTRSGTFLVDADPETTPDGAGGWRSRSLGLPDVAALAVV